MKYSAINIGPIIHTLGMARRPRELWAASYLFSFLMKRIIEALPKEKIISPATFNKDEKYGIGLYPDRAFIKDYEISYEQTIKPVLDQFAKDMGLYSDYFNVMVVSGNYVKDSLAIKDLNHKLDCMELFNMTINRDVEDKLRNFMGLKYDSPLFVDALGSKKFIVESLGEIGAAELCEEEGWTQFAEDIKSDNRTIAEKAYNRLPKDKLKSYHKYICVVQADGDNVGKTVSHSCLPDEKVKVISDAMLQFGKNAAKAIYDFGGLAIYAGGDDLLFIAPVVGKGHTTIFQLLEKLDYEAFQPVRTAIDDCKLKTEDEKNQEIHASLSFGVSITYYKFPLYEALESARNLLFVNAKNIKGKNAIVVDWRKHSGGAFYMELSGADKDLKTAFDHVVTASAVDESVVSAVGHKIRENEGLFKLWLGQEMASQRNANVFKEFLEHNPEKAEKGKTSSDKYKDYSLELLNQLFAVNKNDISKLIQTMYAMLRVAKFINGEEVKDE